MSSKDGKLLLNVMKSSTNDALGSGVTVGPASVGTFGGFKVQDGAQP